MNFLTNIRKNINTWANTSLSVFIVAWLSLIIAPCMMAMGTPAEQLSMENSSTHMSMQAETEDSQNVDSDENHKKSCCDDDCPMSQTRSQDMAQDIVQDTTCQANNLDCTSINKYITQVDQPKLKNDLANNSNHTLDDFEFSTAVFNTFKAGEINPFDETASSTYLPYTPHFSGMSLNDLYGVYLI